MTISTVKRAKGSKQQILNVKQLAEKERKYQVQVKRGEILKYYFMSTNNHKIHL